jgi:hypothetical protein
VRAAPHRSVVWLVAEEDPDLELDLAHPRRGGEEVHYSRRTGRLPRDPRHRVWSLAGPRLEASRRGADSSTTPVNRWTRIELWASPDQVQPCTGLITRATGLDADQFATYVGPSIAVGDPGFHGTTQEVVEYDPPNTPGLVPDNWQALVMGTDLQRPTIELQGLRDRALPPILTLRHATQIVTAGAADDYRLYLFQTRGHGFAPVPIATPNIPDEAFRDAILRLYTRVQSGAWPVDDAITERLASEAPAFAARSAVSCQALMPDASWDKATCEDDPYKWDKAELQACPDASHPKVRSCAPWACFFAVRDGP